MTHAQACAQLIQYSAVYQFGSLSFVSVLRYLIQFLSLCSFVDCGFRVRVSSRVRVSVSFIFFLASFSFLCRLKKQKLPCGSAVVCSDCTA